MKEVYRLTKTLLTTYTCHVRAESVEEAYDFMWDAEPWEGEEGWKELETDSTEELMYESSPENHIALEI